MSKLSHIDADGRPLMVDISDKEITAREAIASGKVEMRAETLKAAISGDLKKGNPISIAELAGIMAAKSTSDLIPLCHPLPITNVKVSIDAINETELGVKAKVKTANQTGVEMEALTAVSVACLTLYDMLKAIDKDMIIGDIKLLKKNRWKVGHV